MLQLENIVINAKALLTEIDRQRGRRVDSGGVLDPLHPICIFAEHLRSAVRDAEGSDEFDCDPNHERCDNPGGHEWVCTGTQYGGDDERWHGEGRCYCIHCGADGDA